MTEPLFTVIDIQTGKEPDMWEIAKKEEWARGLMFCDMEGFAIQDDGTLILTDECGHYVYCPPGRFTVVWPLDAAVKAMIEAEKKNLEVVTRSAASWDAGVSVEVIDQIYAEVNAAYNAVNTARVRVLDLIRKLYGGGDAASSAT
jgi:hypothetical protein